MSFRSFFTKGPRNSKLEGRVLGEGSLRVWKMPLRHWTESRSFPAKVMQENQPASLPMLAGWLGSGRDWWISQRSPRWSEIVNDITDTFVYPKVSRAGQRGKQANGNILQGVEQLTFLGFLVCSWAEDRNLARIGSSLLTLSFYIFLSLFFKLKTF